MDQAFYLQQYLSNTIAFNVSRAQRPLVESCGIVKVVHEENFGCILNIGNSINIKVASNFYCQPLGDSFKNIQIEDID